MFGSLFEGIYKATSARVLNYFVLKNKALTLVIWHSVTVHHTSAATFIPS